MTTTATRPRPKSAPKMDTGLFDGRVQRMVDDVVESFQVTVGQVDGTRSEQVRTWALLLRVLVAQASNDDRSTEGRAREFVLRLAVRGEEGTR